MITRQVKVVAVLAFNLAVLGFAFFLLTYTVTATAGATFAGVAGSAYATYQPYSPYTIFYNACAAPSAGSPASASGQCSNNQVGIIPWLGLGVIWLVGNWSIHNVEDHQERELTLHK